MNSPSSNTASRGAPNTRLYLRETELDEGAALLRAAFRKLCACAQSAAGDTGLLDAELDILIELSDLEGCDVTTLRDRLETPKQSLARNLNNLETKGLIARRKCDRDGRRRLLALTQEGRTIAQKAADGWRNLLAEAFRMAGPDDVLSARRLLTFVAEAAGSESA